jgi:hypothetical protein
LRIQFGFQLNDGQDKRSLVGVWKTFNQNSRKDIQEAGGFDWINNELKLVGFGQRKYNDGNMDEGTFKAGKLNLGFIKRNHKELDCGKNVIMFFDRHSWASTMYHGCKLSLYRNELFF